MLHKCVHIIDNVGPYFWIALSTDPLLIWNYGTVSVIAFVAGCLFFAVTRDLDRQEDALNNLDQGHVESSRGVVDAVP
jgi:hypothetical protein